MARGAFPADVEVMMRDLGVSVSGDGIVAGTKGMYRKGYEQGLSGGGNVISSPVIRLRVQSERVGTEVRQGCVITVDGRPHKLTRDPERFVDDGAFDELVLMEV